jgi:NAD(P)-dependent dehydrogenase (short-subunit alcohol dehydrogenase family)
MTMADMHGKTVLITGANQGIGKVSAIELGKMGAKLILVCRNAEKAKAAVADIQKAGARDVDLHIGDMGSQADIRRVAAEVQAKHDRLDVLLNNAGVLVTKRRETVDGIEETFAINHLGYFLLTNLLTDLLKTTARSAANAANAANAASAGARVVSVSSRAHRGATVNWGDPQLKTGWTSFKAYGQSKLCNILFTRELARRLEGTGVTANCLHPGVIASGFGHTDGGLISVAVRIVSPFLSSPEDGAKTQVYLSSSPEVAGVTGKYFDKCKEAQPSKAALEEGAPQRLWAISEELTSNRTSRAGAAA